MRYHALATDYDGTIATHGYVDEPTVAALRRLKESGRKLLLVTGREIPDLRKVFPDFSLFDRIVAENGALIYRPETQEERVLAEAPPRRFADMLRKRGVSPLSVGRVIVATTEPNETVVLAAIRDLGLELQVIFNKGAVMVLPSGVNKATGLKAALKELGLSPRNVVGVGDAENDHAFLDLCECGAAVANALPALQRRADFVTRQAHGAGVSELIEQLLSSDLSGVGAQLTRHDLVLGRTAQGADLRVASYGTRMLVTGAPGAGELAAAMAWIHQLFQKGYQACVLNTQSEAWRLERAVLFSSSSRPATPDEVLHSLEQAHENVVVSLCGISEADRTTFLQQVLIGLTAASKSTGRPHWLVLDDADSMPAGEPPAGAALAEFANVMFLANQPRNVPHSWLNSVNYVVAVGDNALNHLTDFCRAAGKTLPTLPQFSSGNASLLAWNCADPEAASFTVLEQREQPSVASSPDR